MLKSPRATVISMHGEPFVLKTIVKKGKLILGRGSISMVTTLEEKKIGGVHARCIRDLIMAEYKRRVNLPNEEKRRKVVTD